MSKRHVLAVLLTALFLFNLANARSLEEGGWISLFNGKNFEGWKASENKECFSVEDGKIVAHGRRSHLFYVGPVKNANFKNFEYKVDVMTKPGSNGGLYFHTEYQESGWPSKGFEVQVNNSFTRDPRKTGSLYNIKDVPVNLPDDDEWFTEHIIVKGHRVVVKVNGRVVVDRTQGSDDATLAQDPRKLLSSGTFALQGHDPGSTVYYKNIYVKPLPDDVPSYTAPKGWESLFDGQSLKGWKQKNGTAKYEVTEGTIKGTTVAGSPNSFLCSRPYRDFELELKVLVDSRLNSGIQVRSNSMPEYRDGRVHGYQVEIATNGTAGYVYDEARRRWLSPNRKDKFANAAFKPDAWNDYRIVCVGDSLRTWVNGVPVADVTDSMTGLGFIGLQVHGFKGDTPAWVKWKDIRIKQLRPTKRAKIKAVVVTGGHGFEREPFFKMFDDMRRIDYTEAEQKDHSELFEDISAWGYDVIVFYNMTQNISDKRRANFLKLLDRGVGVVALHHTLGAYQEWPEFKKIIGGKYYLKDIKVDGKIFKQGSYKHDVDMNVAVKAKRHWITRGTTDFVIHDETYKGVWHAPDNHVLLTCDDPTSDEQVGWTRTYKNARVGAIQLAHDGKAYANPNCGKLISRAIVWAAQE